MQLCKMKNIKAIIFDLGAVILNINYQNTINEFRKLGVKNPSSFYSKTYQTKLFDQIETGKISEQDFLLEIQKKTTNANIAEVKNAWNSMLLNLPKKRIALLKKLTQNYSIFLLSNTNAIHIAYFKKSDGLVIGSALCKGISDSLKKRQNPVINLNKMVKELKSKII